MDRTDLNDRWSLLTGDLTFSEEQLLSRGLRGIAYDLAAAQATLTQSLRFVRETPTVFLLTHDPLALRRLATAATVTGKGRLERRNLAVDVASI